MLSLATDTLDSSL